MLSLLYKIYLIKANSAIIDNTLQKVVIRLANYLLPVYFRLTGWSRNNSINATIEDRRYIIVSLTTFPARINRVWLTVETILRQIEKPNKVILWLYKGECKDIISLPPNLRRLERRGLEIRFCDENIMPHKKYYYTMQEYPEAYIITIDDDILYPPDLIKKLKFYNLKYPGAIICPISMRIKVSGGRLQKYRDWEYVKRNSPPEFSNLMIGAGSVLYPPGALHDEVFNLSVLKETALTADDLWLKVMSIKKQTKVVSIADEYERFFIYLIFRGDTKLENINIRDGENDKILDGLLTHYQIPLTLFGD